MQDVGCGDLLALMKEKPQTTLPARFHAYSEMKGACTLYRKRTPVPNDSKAGCSQLPGRRHLCLYDSCRDWWETTFGSSTLKNQGWKDASPAYLLNLFLAKYNVALCFV